MKNNILRTKLHQALLFKWKAPGLCGSYFFQTRSSANFSKIGHKLSENR